MRATPKPTARPRRWSWAAPIPPTLARSTISLSPTRRSSRWCRTPSRAAFAARSQWCGGCRAHADQGADQDNRKRLALALGPRPVPHRKQQRHHQRRKRRGAELRLLPERRTTLRQGVEAKVNLTWNRWSAYANYTFIDATYQSFLTLPGVNNLMATIDPVTGSAIINVIPGD